MGESLYEGKLSREILLEWEFYNCLQLYNRFGVKFYF